jgi:hypothetical protein
MPYSPTTSTNKKIDLRLGPHPQPFSQRERGEKTLSPSYLERKELGIHHSS